VSEDGTLRHVVDYIDRMVLARRLRVELGDGRIVHLDAENRRLLRYCDPVGPESASTPKETSCEPADNATIARDLGSLFLGTTIARLSVIDQPVLPGPKPTGVAVSALLDTLPSSGPNDASPSLEDRLHAFVDTACGEVLAAAMLTEEELVAIHGPDSLVLAMEDWVRDAFGLSDTPDATGTLTVGSEDVCAVCWNAPSPRHVLIVGRPDCIGVILMAGDDTATSLGDLRAILGGAT
jgi:hypothetical protein